MDITVVGFKDVLFVIKAMIPVKAGPVNKHSIASCKSWPVICKTTDI